MAATDARLRTALVRNRLVLTVCTGGLAVAVPVLAAIGDGDTATVVGLGGVVALVVAAGALTLDSWVGWRRPAPRMGGGGVVLRAHPVASVAPTVAAVGLVLVAVSFLLEPGGVASVSGGRRGGLFAWGVIVVAPLLLLGAFAWLARPDRVLLDPAGVRVRRLGRTRGMRWDQIRGVVVLPDDPGLVLRLEGADGAKVLLPTRQLAPTTWEMRALLWHHVRDAAAREQLADPGALERIGRLRADAAVPGEGPAWFPAPRGGAA